MVEGLCDEVGKLCPLVVWWCRYVLLTVFVKREIEEASFYVNLMLPSNLLSATVAPEV